MRGWRRRLSHVPRLNGAGTAQRAIPTIPGLTVASTNLSFVCLVCFVGTLRSAGARQLPFRLQPQLPAGRIDVVTLFTAQRGRHVLFLERSQKGFLHRLIGA